MYTGRATGLPTPAAGLPPQLGGRRGAGGAVWFEKIGVAWREGRRLMEKPPPRRCQLHVEGRGLPAHGLCRHSCTSCGSTCYEPGCILNEVTNSERVLMAWEAELIRARGGSVREVHACFRCVRLFIRRCELSFELGLVFSAFIL